MRAEWRLIAALIAMGAGWGITQPLAKIAVSEGYRHIGVIFWQLLIGAVAIGALRWLFHGRSRGRPQDGLPRVFGVRVDRGALLFYAVIALIGTILPNGASYEAARYLPAGLISILLSLVPIFAFPIALALGNERFVWLRFGGLLLGVLGVALITVPEASLPDRAMIAFIPLALVAPLFYGLEGNVVAKWGTAGLSAMDLLFGASLIGAVIALPIAVLTGEFINPLPPYGAPDAAIVLSSVVHVVVYSSYVWMVGRAGPVFAVQVSYLVTLFGVFWASLLLGETYSGWVFAAMGVIFLGVLLVQPKPRDSLAADAAGSDTPG